MVNMQNYTGALIRDYQGELIQVVLGVCGERQNERSYPNLTELPKLTVTYILYCSGSQTVVRVPLVVLRGVSQK